MLGVLATTDAILGALTGVLIPTPDQGGVVAPSEPQEGIVSPEQDDD